MNEQYLNIAAGSGSLSAILHHASATIGVVLIVGGPQYRVGSHRQFIKLSRALAAQGIPSLRFDSQGMGDSSGDKADFYQQDADINTAISAFFQHCPQLKQVVLWGLCDAASAILIKLNQPDERIGAVVLLNPWVRQQHSYAQTLLKHYYLKRLFSRQFWRKVLGGGVALRRSISEIWHTVQQRTAKHSALTQTPVANEQNYVGLMLRGWQQFHGKVLLITSGNDLTAQEFLELCASQSAWTKCQHQAKHYVIANASHTFSSHVWREQVEQQSCRFVRSLIDGA
jgi:uncharacterized protein